MIDKPKTPNSAIPNKLTVISKAMSDQLFGLGCCKSGKISIIKGKPAYTGEMASSALDISPKGNTRGNKNIHEISKATVVFALKPKRERANMTAVKDKGI